MKKITYLFILCFSFLGFSQEIDESTPEFQKILGYYQKTLKYKDTQQFDLAIVTCEKALAAFKKQYGITHLYYGNFQNILAYFYNELGNHNEAIRLSISATEITKNRFGNAHSEYAKAITNLATLYSTVDQYKKALPLYLEALEITEKTLGTSHSNYGDQLSKISLLYDNIGQYDKALLMSKAAIENTKKSHGETHVVYGRNLRDLAGIHVSLNQYDKALPLYLEAIENFKKTLGIKHSEYGSCLGNLAGVYKQLNQFNKALPLYLESLENTKTVLGKEHYSYGSGLSSLAGLYHSIDQHDKALPLYLEALENVKKTLGVTHSTYGDRLNSLAFLYKDMGLYKKAIPLLLAALENTKKSLGKDHLTYGTRQTSLAMLYDLMGMYNKALPLFQAALENTKKTYGKTHSKYGVRLNNLAGIYESLGQYNKALPLAIEALDNCKNTLGIEDEFYGTCLNNLAGLYQELKEYDKALSLYTKALQNIKQIHGTTHSSYAVTQNNLAFFYKTIGEYDKALPLYIAALENCKNTLGTGHSNYGNRSNNLASLYVLMGEYKKAIPLLNESLINAEKTLGIQNESYGNSLFNLALLYLNLNDFKTALEYQKKYNETIINQIKQNFSFQNENGKEAFMKNKVKTGLNHYSNFNYLTDNSYTEAILLATNNLLTSKGLLLNSAKDLLRQLESLNLKNVNDKVAAFRPKKIFINQQLQLPISRRDTSFDTELITLENLERELTNIYTAHFGEDVNYIKDWKNTPLKDNELAIEFTHFKLYDKKWTDSIIYVAYLYKKDWDAPKAITLFEEKQLKHYFTSSENLNQLYKTRGAVGASSKMKTSVADSIYKLVWEPLEKYTNTSSKIYYSPDGLLHKIPFAALPNKDNKLIGELYDIQQMGNTAAIRQNTSQPNLNDVLLIGGINYEYKLGTSKEILKDSTYNILQSEYLLGNEMNRSISASSFAYLPGTLKEITAINTKLSGSKKLTGKDATETAFKELSGNSPSVLHIATHGFFFPKLKEVQKEGSRLEKDKSYIHSENPLLRSGLIFSNANYAWENGNNPYEEDDGILTALEISNLDLKNTDIVILSACETGLGDIEGSEGVYGLQRAFKMAGVKTIIMSLWEVPDAETAEFMDFFYTKWEATNNARNAFRNTQIQMMQKYRDQPQKWAAFVMIE